MPSAVVPEQPMVCGWCRGRTSVQPCRINSPARTGDMIEAPCPDCGGSGWQYVEPVSVPPENESCDTCGGSGIIRITLTADPERGKRLDSVGNFRDGWLIEWGDDVS